MRHLGPAVTAFVDGELEGPRLEEVLDHLTFCEPCRAEVDALRSFKSVLRGTGPAVPNDLTARLLSVMETVEPPVVRRRPRLHRVPRTVRRTALGGAVVALGLGGALSLAGPPPRGPVPPVDPTSTRFVVDHGASTTGGVPLRELDVVTASLP